MECGHCRVKVVVYTMNKVVTELRCLDCGDVEILSVEKANPYANITFNKLRAGREFSCYQCEKPIAACENIKPWKIERWRENDALLSVTYYKCPKKIALGWSECHTCVIKEGEKHGVDGTPIL